MCFLVSGCQFSVDDTCFFFLCRRRLFYQYSEMQWETLLTFTLTQQFVQHSLLSLPHLFANLLFHQVYYQTVFSVHGQKLASQRVIGIANVSTTLLQEANDPEALLADGIMLVTNPLLAKPAAKGHLSSPGQLCQKCIKERSSCLRVEARAVTFRWWAVTEPEVLKSSAGTASACKTSACDYVQPQVTSVELVGSHWYISNLTKTYSPFICIVK